MKGWAPGLKELYPIDKEKVKHITEDVDNAKHLRSYLCSCTHYLSSLSCNTVLSVQMLHSGTQILLSPSPHNSIYTIETIYQEITLKHSILG